MEDQILERDNIFQNGNITFSIATKGELKFRFASTQPSNSHISLKLLTQDKQIVKEKSIRSFQTDLQDTPQYLLQFAFFMHFQEQRIVVDIS